MTSFPSAGRIFDSVVGNLAKNFAEGTEYFKVKQHSTKDGVYSTYQELMSSCIYVRLQFYLYVR